MILAPVPAAYFRAKLQDFEPRLGTWRISPGIRKTVGDGRSSAQFSARSNLQFATLRARIEEEANFGCLLFLPRFGVALRLEVTVRP
jgi:hypothetical protein